MVKLKIEKIETIKGTKSRYGVLETFTESPCKTKTLAGSFLKNNAKVLPKKPSLLHMYLLKYKDFFMV